MFVLTMPRYDAESLDLAERIAIDCAARPFEWFRDNYFAMLPMLTPCMLAALAAEFYARNAQDHAHFAMMMSYEVRLPAEQRRSCEQLLVDLTAAGFRRPLTPVLRRAQEAYLRELEQPPQSPEVERTEWLADLRKRVRALLNDSGKAHIRPHHRLLLEAMPADDSALDDEAALELDELCLIYRPRNAQMPVVSEPAASLSATTSRPARLLN